MIHPFINAHKIVPHFTPSKCHNPKAKKLNNMPIKQLTQSYTVLNLLILNLNRSDTSFTNISDTSGEIYVWNIAETPAAQSSMPSM